MKARFYILKKVRRDYDFMQQPSYIYESKIELMIDGELCHSVFTTDQKEAEANLDSPSYREFILHRLRDNIVHYLKDELTKDMKEIKPRILNDQM